MTVARASQLIFSTLKNLVTPLAMLNLPLIFQLNQTALDLITQGCYNIVHRYPLLTIDKIFYPNYSIGLITLLQEFAYLIFMLSNRLNLFGTMNITPGLSIVQLGTTIQKSQFPREVMFLTISMRRFWLLGIESSPFFVYLYNSIIISV